MNRFDDSSLIDLYLDDLLDPPQRAAFESRLAADPDMAAAVDRQQRINAALQRTHVAPAPDAVLRRLPVGPPPRVISLWRQRLTAVAALIALTFGLKLIWSNFGPAAPLTPPTLDEVYYAQVAAGFEPYWTCDSDEQFIDTFQRRLGQPLLAHAPANAGTWGLAYAPVFSSRSVLVLVESDGTRAVVVVDRRDTNQRPRRTTPSTLHVFSRDVGDLVLYEITPADEAHCLELFEIPVSATAPGPSSPPRFPVQDSLSHG